MRARFPQSSGRSVGRAPDRRRPCRRADHTARNPGPAGASGRRAVNPAGCHGLRRLHLSDRPEGNGCRWERVLPEHVQHPARLHQRDRPALAPDRVPCHARHRARNRQRQQPVGELYLPPQVRVRPVQLRSVDGPRDLRAVRYAADPVDTDSRGRPSRIARASCRPRTSARRSVTTSGATTATSTAAFTTATTTTASSSTRRRR